MSDTVELHDLPANLSKFGVTHRTGGFYYAKGKYPQRWLMWKPMPNMRRGGKGAAQKLFRLGSTTQGYLVHVNRQGTVAYSRMKTRRRAH